MINLLCKLCDCGKSRPTYNVVGKSANYCFSCKEDGMVNVNDKMCECGSCPTFNYAGLKAEYCAKCKKLDMIDVVHQKCKCCKKTKPSFNYIGLKAEYCKKCKTPDMINLTHAKCKCGKVQPSFNFTGLPAQFCGKCKEVGMILLIKKKCIICTEKQATYNIEGLPAEYCNSCKTLEMINVVDKCHNDKCIRTGSMKYKYYCTFCFQHLFPTDELSKNIRVKTKENYVKDYLNEIDEEFIHDIPLWTGNCDCSHRRRIDFRKLVGNTLLCIEVDEFQHKRYDKTEEEIRYDDLFMLHGGKFIFIRFNPDPFTNSLGTKKNPYMKKRMDYLKEEIYIQIERIEQEKNSELLEISYLFYDNCEFNL
jgi:hypothetical protein